ncbi:hypothetical protein LCGC14_0791090 [marine sediment metagenome]|uniref:Uncharacterized protein n=1 Tax=marine sediment metagenome TaxID=412755 RepID=A0A0F9QC90_9ZZZZ
MPIKGLTEKRRMPRIGKFHLGIKVQGKKGEYPKAVDYFVYPKDEAPGVELLDELTTAFGAKPKELRIIFPLEDEESIASQYYRCYTRSRGLVCRGDGEISMRVVDAKTGDLPTKDTNETTLKEMTCAGKECPNYQAGQCREVMNLQFMLPEISGMGVWQIDTSSINSIRNINSCLDMIRAIYNRVAMVPLILTLEKMEVTPPGGTKKNVHVLNIRSTDTMIEAAIKAQKPPLELISGPTDIAQAEADIASYWPVDEQDRQLNSEEAANRMTPKEIADNSKQDGVAGDEPVKAPTSTTEVPPGVEEEPVPELWPEDQPPTTTPAPESQVAQGAAGYLDENVKDMAWIKENLPKVNWTEKTACTWLTSKFAVKGGLLEDIVSQLTKDQYQLFVKEIEDRLEMA